MEKKSRGRPKSNPHIPRGKKKARRSSGKSAAAGEDAEIRGEEIQHPDKEKPRKPRQARLPEMEDPQIEDLEATAEEYAEVRDERVQLTAREVPLKEKLLQLMKANGKTSYHRDGISVKIVAEKETVKVKVKKSDSEKE